MMIAIRPREAAVTVTVLWACLDDSYPWDVGRRIDDAEHDEDSPEFPFGYVHAGQPYADNIYQETGQIFAINSWGVCEGGDHADLGCADDLDCPRWFVR